MYRNNIVNFQESTTILNAHTEKVWKIIEGTTYIYIYIYICSMFYIYIYIYVCVCVCACVLCYVLRVFHTNIIWWFPTGVCWTLSLLKSPGLFSVFLLICSLNGLHSSSHFQVHSSILFSLNHILYSSKIIYEFYIFLLCTNLSLVFVYLRN